MSASRLRRTARSSWRMRTCSSRKRWISACCSGLISSELPSLRDALQLAQALLGLRELGLEPVLGRAELEVGVAAQLLDARERPRVRRAAAQADQRRAAGEVVERVDDEVAVVRERGDEPLPEEILRLHPEPIAQACRRRRRARGWRSRSTPSARSRAPRRRAPRGPRPPARRRGTRIFSGPSRRAASTYCLPLGVKPFKQLLGIRQELEAVRRHGLGLDARGAAAASASPSRLRRARSSPATPKLTELKPDVIGSSWLMASASRPSKPMWRIGLEARRRC